MEYFGLSTYDVSISEQSSRLVANRFLNLYDGILVQLELHVSATSVPASSLGRLGIYGDNNGVPGQLIADLGEMDRTHSYLAGGYWIVNVSPSIPVYAGTYYWLASTMSYRGWVSMQSGQEVGSYVYASLPYGPMPAVFPAISGSGSTQYAMRALVDTDTAPPPIVEYTLDIVEGEGGTTVPSAGQYTYNEGTVVPITAVPSSGYEFVGWLKNGVSFSTSLSTNLTIDSDIVLTPVFQLIPEVLGTVTGNISLVPNFDSIGVYCNYTGDDQGKNSAFLEYRQLGTDRWIRGMDLYADRARKQYRGVVIGNIPPNGLISNMPYEVQVTFEDSQGVSGVNPVSAITTTLNDNPAIGARRLYVSVNGSDSNDGISPDTPLRTLSQAASKLTAGTTVLVMEGIYYEQMNIQASGNVNDYITIMPYDDDVVIIDGGDSFDWGFNVTGNYVRIRNFTIQNTWGGPEYGGGISFANCTGGIAEFNHLINPAKNGSRVGSAGIMLNTAVRNTLVQYNIIEKTINSGSIGGIMRRYSGEGNCVRYNNIHAPGQYWADCIGNYPEDYDLTQYNNEVSCHHNNINGAVDDGIQSEGAGINARFWSNVILPPFLCGISMCGIKTGPSYYFRNVIVTGDGSHAHWKLGDEGDSCGPKYLYHNTLYASGVGVGDSGTDSAQQTDSNMGKFIFKNNIAYCTRYVYEMPTSLTGGPDDMDYNNLYTKDTTRFTKWQGNVYYNTLAKHQAGTGMDIHSISVADNRFIDVTAYDFRLQADSPNIGKGTLLPGFNDEDSLWPAQGLPDLGAFEYGGFEVVYSLTLDFTGEGMINPATGTYSYSEGSSVLITAEPSLGWEFLYWKEGNTTYTEQTLNVIMTGDRSLTAVFTAIPEYQLSVIAQGEGEVGVTGEAPYEPGAEVTLTALPMTGWVFAGWEENGTIVSTDSTITIVMDSDKNLTAIFTEEPVVPSGGSIGLGVGVAVALITAVIISRRKK